MVSVNIEIPLHSSMVKYSDISFCMTIGTTFLVIKLLMEKALVMPYRLAAAYGSNVLRDVRTQSESDKIASETRPGNEFFQFL